MRIKNMAQNQTQSASANKKISTYLMLIVLIVMALSIVALFIAGYTYATALTVSDQLTARRLSRHRLNRINTVSVFALPIKTAISTGEN